MKPFHTLTVIGIGLLGGSVGLAAKRRGLVDRVIGVARTEATLALARRRGCADETTSDPVSAVREADLVVLAAPVGALPGLLRQVAPSVRPEAVITDVASTKASLCRVADELLTGRVAFVGGHPMAGDDQTGVANAREELFTGCVWVLTPSAASTPEATARVERFAHQLGARVRRFDPTVHDRLVAATSHLPHVAAAALVHAVWHATDGDEAAADLAASGFRDTSRVAAASAALWDDIVVDNAAALLPALAALEREVRTIREAVSARDEQGIHDFLATAAEYRSRLLREGNG